MALITIGIPVYNEEKYLAETIDSAINQEFTDTEIIISDNLSTDKSANIIKYYNNFDKRIRAIFHNKNIGPSANFRTLLDNATSKYFVFLGGHDIFLPHYIGEAISFLEANPDCVMCYPESKLIDGNDDALGYFDSDIDSADLNLQRRMRKVAANLSWCTCFHGVFRTAVIKQLPILKIRGSDHLLLFAASYHGPIHWIRNLGILRRESRQESPKMTEERRIKNEVYSENGNRYYDSMSIMVQKHIEFIFKQTNIKLFDKIILSCAVALIFRHRFGVPLLSILFSYADKKHKNIGGNSCL